MLLTLEEIHNFIFLPEICEVIMIIPGKLPTSILGHKALFFSLLSMFSKALLYLHRHTHYERAMRLNTSKRMIKSYKNAIF